MFPFCTFRRQKIDWCERSALRRSNDLSQTPFWLRFLHPILSYNGNRAEPLKLLWYSFSTWIWTGGCGLIGEALTYLLGTDTVLWLGMQSEPELPPELSPRYFLLCCHFAARLAIRSATWRSSSFA